MEANECMHFGNCVLFHTPISQFFFTFQEQLFVSKRSVFDGKKPIRGGIPFVFPVFGSSTILPQHGFARITRWQLEKGPERLHTGDIEAIFSLTDTDFTRQMWNCQFRVSYRLILRYEQHKHSCNCSYGNLSEAGEYTYL